MNTQRTALNIDTVLFQNNTWSIELMDGRKELAVTNGGNVYYAYYDSNVNVLRWDNPYPVPSYIRAKALKLAAKSMISIYA